MIFILNFDFETLNILSKKKRYLATQNQNSLKIHNAF